jgi:hypothetical protein
MPGIGHLGQMEQRYLGFGAVAAVGHGMGSYGPV